MSVRGLLERAYVRRLQRQLAGAPLPQHIGIVTDGNRRWARRAGLGDPSSGHRAGAEHLERVLTWCVDAGVRHVTMFGCSDDNLRSRSGREVAALMGLIEEVVHEVLLQPVSRWRVHLAGSLDLLPDSTARALKLVEEQTSDRTGAHVTLAIGYGGRQEIVEAMRSALLARATAGDGIDRVAAELTEAEIAAHVATAGQPDVDLIIRTSGEQRLSGFLLWQSARSELCFCDAYWPGFRRIDLLRALRLYGARRRTSADPSSLHS
ncbi:MAG: polyprenyl diphosphate synthase [Nocardioidaceae bacterium]